MTSQSSRQILQVRAAIAALVSVGLVACSTPVYGATQPTTKLRFPHTHMEESVRDLIETVIVMPHTNDAEMGVFGTYGRETTPVSRAAMDASILPLYVAIDIVQRTPNVLVPPEIIIPYLVLPWALAGATYAKIRQEIQEFRDVRPLPAISIPSCVGYLELMRMCSPKLRQYRLVQMSSCL